MLFRPEELHEASGIGSVQIPITKGQRAVGDDTAGVAIFDDPVLDLHPHGRTAIETRSIDLNGFAWEEPADRQRFITSLGEPTLAAIDSDAILGRKIVERRI